MSGLANYWFAPWERAEALDGVAAVLSGVALVVALAIAWFEFHDRRGRDRRSAERFVGVITELVNDLLQGGDVVQPYLDAARSDEEGRVPRMAFANLLRITIAAFARIAPSTPPDAGIHRLTADIASELDLAASIFSEPGEGAQLSMLRRLKSELPKALSALSTAAGKV